MYFNCHTGFSFKYGTLPIKTLFNEAKRCGIHKLALTEINNVSSYLEMLRICDENKARSNGLTKFEKIPYDLNIPVGIEFRSEENDLLYIALAKNNDGFEKLNRFLSYHNQENEKFPARAPEIGNVFIGYPYQKIEPELLLPNEYVGMCTTDLYLFPIDPCP